MQVSYTIPWVFAELRHGVSMNSKRSKYVRGLLKKMDALSSVMDWLLMERDYGSQDELFPKAFQLNAAKGVALLTQVGNAFRNFHH